MTVNSLAIVLFSKLCGISELLYLDTQRLLLVLFVTPFRLILNPPPLPSPKGSMALTDLLQVETVWPLAPHPSPPD